MTPRRDDRRPRFPGAGEIRLGPPSSGPAFAVPKHRPGLPIVAFVLAALNVVIYVWDRQGVLFGPSIVFADLGMRPREVASALWGMAHGSTGDRFPLVTVLTAMFLHGGMLHLLGNLVFLLVFGAGVEEAIGSVRFALYYLGWGLAAAAAQIWVNPGSTVPTLGASGAIGGALGAYFLLFPASKIEIALPFFDFEVPAYLLLGGWFLWQIFAPQEGVANWAHVGGFVAGMVTILVAGGRTAVLKGAGMNPALPDG